MYELELIFLILMVICGGALIVSGYKNLINRKTFPHDITNGVFITVFTILTAVILIGTYLVLITLASFDVVADNFYIFYYLVMTFGFIYIHIVALYIGLNLSIKDDILNNSNKATMMVIVSSLLGLSTVFAAANIGDGPGFYTVIIASGIGLIAFIILMRIFDIFTNTLEHIQSDHNIFKAIRYSVLALSLCSLLAYGAQGDWSGFSYTVVEFLVAWPAVILIVLAIILENLFKKQDDILSSLFVSAIYVGFTVYAFLELIHLFDFVEIILGGY